MFDSRSKAADGLLGCGATPNDPLRSFAMTGQSTKMASEITVASLAINHWELVSKLFATSSGVEGCWCMWPRRSRGTHTPDQKANRAAMKEILDSGQSPGLIALVGERAVGWCAIGPRDTYLQYEPAIGQRCYWAIPCLYVDPMADRSSVARALIEAAVTLASKNAAVVVEGPPPYWLPGDRAGIAEAIDTFVENGFEQVGPGARMPELRRAVRTDK
jgi:GNAT superfamily N-acetyltransferase